MADHYVALNDGVEGFKYSDFITGTANTVGVNQVELRVQDGTNLTRKDVDKHPRSLSTLLPKCPAIFDRWVSTQPMR
jgi:hypothetical protein